MKKNFIASGILAASVASSIGQGDVFAVKKKSLNIFKGVKNFLKKSKFQIAGITATLGAFLAKKGVFDVKEIRKVKEGDKLPDVAGMAQDCSHMFLSMDETEFKDSIRRAEFYQLYSAFKYGYNGLLPLGEASKERYLTILYDEMDRRLTNGEVLKFFDKYWKGINLRVPKEKLIQYIRQLILYDPKKGDKGVPIFLAIGSGGSGKSYGFELAVRLLSGINYGDSLSLVNEDEKSIVSKISGAPSNYQNSGTTPYKTIGKATDVDRMFSPLRFDEVDKTRQGALGSLLEPINDGLWTWNFNEKKYPITYGIYMTANFKNHDFVEGAVSYMSKWGWNEQDLFRWLLSSHLKDAAPHLGEAFMTRVGGNIAIFVAPRRAEVKEYFDDRIKETQASALSAHYFIDPSLSEEEHDKVLDLIFENQKKDAVAPKLSFREASFGIIPTLNSITTNQNPGVSIAGKDIMLGLDETGKELQTEVMFGQNRRPYRN